MIELFSADTPNGKKIGIMLEEINFEYKIMIMRSLFSIKHKLIMLFCEILNKRGFYCLITNEII